MHDHVVFGMRLHSDRPMPLLAPWQGGDARPIDLEIVTAPVPPFESGIAASNELFDAHEDGRVIVHPQDGPRILLERGRRMIVDDGGIPAAQLHTWLFGTGIGALLHQRARPPLHAAILEVRGHGVALVGDTGAGKSTTARALLARGHRLLSDDLGVVDPLDWQTQAGFPSMKLSAEGARRWGDAVNPAMKVSAGKDKYHIPLSAGFRNDAVHLQLLVVLQAAEASAQPVLTPIPPVQAASLVHRFIYRRRIGRTLDGGRAAFDLSTRLARAIPVVVLRRPDDVGQLDRLCSLIEDAVQQRAVRT